MDQDNNYIKSLRVRACRCCRINHYTIIKMYFGNNQYSSFGLAVV